MHDIDQHLPDLMRRATAELEPDSTDLVRRGMQKGLRLRRRRTAGLSIAAASMLVLTGAGVVAAQSFGAEDDAPFAGTPGLSVPQQASKPTATPSTAKPVASQDTLVTLRKVVPATLRVSDPKHWGGNWGFTAASITVDDGKGLSELGVLIERREVIKKCPAGNSRSCQVLPDGSVVLGTELEPVYSNVPSDKFPNGRPDDRGVNYNRVDLHRRDGVTISLTNYTSRDEKGSPNTRELPVFSVAQLTTIARSPLWKAPAAGPKSTRTDRIQGGEIQPTPGK